MADDGLNLWAPRPWDAPPPGFAIGGNTFPLRPRPVAADVLPVLLASDDPIKDNPIPLVFWALARPADARTLAGLQQQRLAALPLLHEIADTIGAAWFGWQRWEARRIWLTALSSWPEIDGELTGHGVNVLRLPADRATNAVYAVMRGWFRGANDPKAWTKFDTGIRSTPIRVAERELIRQMEAEDAAEFLEIEPPPVEDTGSRIIRT